MVPVSKAYLKWKVDEDLQVHILIDIPACSGMWRENPLSDLKHGRCEARYQQDWHAVEVVRFTVYRSSVRDVHQERW